MTKQEAAQALVEMHNAKLYGWQWVESLGVEKVAAACNGCGPDSWPQEWRDRLGKWLVTFRLAFNVHDCRFDEDNDGTRERFDYANDELEKNCKLLADIKYAWFNPLRYFARRGGRLVAAACRTDIGWQSWLDAYNKNKNNNKE